MSTVTIVICDRCKGETRMEQHIARAVRVVAGPNAYVTDLCASCFSEMCDWLNLPKSSGARLDAGVK